MGQMGTSGIQVKDRSRVELLRGIFHKKITVIELFDALEVLTAADDYSTEIQHPQSIG